MSRLRRLFPFLHWFPLSASVVRADVLAGITVALVLIPQSMAYAQLAGLPAYYGLYAAFLPPMVAAMFGSSHQLATGPVAVVSLLTAAALEPLASVGGEVFVAYAIMLALLVGLFQLSLGVLRLGVLVNFLSHPVVIGFTNAAAIIIATSQLGRIFGVTVEKAPYHYQTVWNTLVAATTNIHWPTFFIAVFAFCLMLALRRYSPRLPSVLIAVTLTTIISWAFDYEEISRVRPEQIIDSRVQDLLSSNARLREQILANQQAILQAEQQSIKPLPSSNLVTDAKPVISNKDKIDSLYLKYEELKRSMRTNNNKLKNFRFERIIGSAGTHVRFYLPGKTPDQTTGASQTWRLITINDDLTLSMTAGNRVVSAIPQGLPAFRLPHLDFDILLQLLASAVTISLIGFMEAVSIAKAMAVRTGQKLDANQELIGQGLSNIVGSLFQSYPVSGSFSRSALNIDTGAKTGLSSVVTGLAVIITLLWLTPLLYHLPQATLAAVIVIAVSGLINFRAFSHIWRAHRYDAGVAVITFVLTLLLAPHLEQAIIVGIVLSLGLHWYRRR